MKKITNIIIALALVLSSCNPNEKGKQKLLNDNTLFSISPTTDPTFCSTDSVVGTDCGIGDLYLTKEGNVLYSPFCMGLDTFTYYIGKYNITDTGIVCSFNSEYSYSLGCDGCPEEIINPVNPNAGKIRGGVEFNLILKKTNCKIFPYYIANSINEYKQALELISNKNEYYQEISEIKALNQFHDSNLKTKKSSMNLIDEDIISKIVSHYVKKNINYTPHRKETDSIIDLSFYENEEDLAVSYLTISKVKSDHLFGDLNNDNNNDVLAIVFASGGGSYFWYDIFTFISEHDKLVLKSVTQSSDLTNCFGGTIEGNFQPLEIKDGILIGESICYAENDAHCCPSIKHESKAIYKNGGLIKLK
jgi:hypothetical protein